MTTAGTGDLYDGAAVDAVEALGEQFATTGFRDTAVSMITA